MNIDHSTYMILKYISVPRTNKDIESKYGVNIDELINKHFAYPPSLQELIFESFEEDVHTISASPFGKALLEEYALRRNNYRLSIFAVIVPCILSVAAIVISILAL